MATFKVGDLVKSKAGGPKLVVDAVHAPFNVLPTDNDETTYSCIWWVGSKRHRESFSESGLEPWTERA